MSCNINDVLSPFGSRLATVSATEQIQECPGNASVTCEMLKRAV
jgi:hypothetical protein